MTDQPAAAEFWADWITIWQSEMAALAVDREVQEAIQRAVDLAAKAALMLYPADRGREPGRHTGPTMPPGSPATGDAAARDAELGRLHDRIAELERRLGQSG